ncbi:SDR family NAD(P)-dependent oxidoreductase [Streptomyces flaveolus]|uniref:SDR family NAD(P)-dependent oxidoreductase n=1 Tax=Streptomyces flaveolus TaxID=67297 RepID=UPI0033D1676C
MTKTIFVTGVTDVFGAAIARSLADVGHTVYVGCPQTSEVSAPAVGATDEVIGTDATGLRTVPFAPIDQRSVSAAVRSVEAEAGPIDVVIHTVMPVTLGPVESFTAYQLGQLYDACVLSAQRVNRAVLPRMRERREGLLIWTASPAEPGPGAFLGPGHALRAAQGRLAEAYAAELAPLGIDVTVLAYGRASGETGGPAASVHAADTDTAASYRPEMTGPLRHGEEHGTSAAPVAEQAAAAVARVVAAPQGTRPVYLVVGPSVPRQHT